MGLTACLSPFLLPFGPYVVSQRFSYIIINSPPNGLHINLFVIMDLHVHWDEHNRCSEQFRPPDSCCCAFYTTAIAGLSFGTLYSVSYTVQLKVSTIYMYIYIYILTCHHHHLAKQPNDIHLQQKDFLLHCLSLEMSL